MKNSKNRQFLFTALLTIALSAIGFMLLHFKLTGYGYTFFILVPLCIGFFLGKEPSWKTSSIFALLVGLVAFFYLLLTAQLEGLFCIITLLPLAIVLILFGTWLGWEIRKSVGYTNSDVQLNVYPLIILLMSGSIEHYFSKNYDHRRVESKIFLPYPKEVVFDYIKSVDTLNTAKPLLLQLGLSVPQKCILDKEAVGAKRICYFKEGTISEKVTAFERGKILKMNVTDYNLPGRKWLKFDEAIYLFEAKPTGTLLTRITTYKTELKPRFYWLFWEEKAIEAEHEYVLNDLKKRLDLNYIPLK